MAQPWIAALRGKFPDPLVDAIEQLSNQNLQMSRSIQHVNSELANRPTQAEVQSQLIATQQSLATLPAFDLTNSGSSTGVKNQASMVPTVSGNFSYTATANSITWFWDGTNGSTILQINWPDGSITSVPPSSVTVNGLSPSTTYIFYPLFSVDLNRIQFVAVAGGIGTPGIAYLTSNLAAATVQSADGSVITVSENMTAVTPASGSSGGSGGGSGGGCVAEWILVEPLTGPASVTMEDAELWIDVRTNGGRRLVAVPEHRIYTDEGKMEMVNMMEGIELVTQSGLDAVTCVRKFKQKMRKKKIHVPMGHLYWANGVLSHNLKRL